MTLPPKLLAEQKLICTIMKIYAGHCDEWGHPQLVSVATLDEWVRERMEEQYPTHVVTIDDINEALQQIKDKG